VFLKLSATADHYMGGGHTCEQLGCPNIPFNHKDQAVVPFYENRKKIIVKVAIKHFFCP
jgi:hypothetical protein